MGTVFDVFAGTLSDERIQLFAITFDDPATYQVWSCWQHTIDDKLVWSVWTPFSLHHGGSPARGVATQGERAELQVLTQVDYFGQSGGLGVGQEITKTAIVATGKVSSDPNAAWAGQSLYEIADAGLGSFVAGRTSGGGAQLFLTAGETLTRLQRADGTWEPSAALGLGRDDITLTAIGSLSDKRLQLWGTSTEGEVGIWSAWQTTEGSWHGWSPFQLAHNSATLTATASAQLPDGTLQVWGIGGFDESGDEMQVASCQKSTPDANSPWTPWTIFPTSIPFTDSDTVSLAVALRSDGLLQLWMLINGSLHTMSQNPAEPPSEWTDLTPFPTP